MYFVNLIFGQIYVILGVNKKDYGPLKTKGL